MGHHAEIYEIAVRADIQTPEQALQAAFQMVREENGTNYNINAGRLQVQSPKTKGEAYDDDEIIGDAVERSGNPPSIVTPLVDESNLSRRTVRKTLAFTGAQWEKSKAHGGLHSLIAKAAAQEVTLRQSERVEGVSPNEGDQSSKSFYSPALANGAHINRTSRIITRNTEGKAVTRYTVLANGNRHNGHRELWNDGHSSQAAARKHMIDLMDRHADSDYMDEAEIVAVTRREDGSPLAVSKREVSKVKVNVLVTIAKVPDNANISHYRVSFGVHS